jgi:hypothetical protein
MIVAKGETTFGPLDIMGDAVDQPVLGTPLFVRNGRTERDIVAIWQWRRMSD